MFLTVAMWNGVGMPYTGRIIVSYFLSADGYGILLVGVEDVQASQLARWSGRRDTTEREKH